MKYLIAVSGGIDSVVLLDQLVNERRHELIVAHFDHGIREDSVDDARFVKGLADFYSLPFVVKREELGAGASEDKARTRRYTFLFDEVEKHGAVLATAHHADDIIETIAINLTRGTGWRGLAVLDSVSIVRPLLRMTKQEIRAYAKQRRLEWVEDSTNAGDQYLRNRMRRKISFHLKERQKHSILALWKRQLELKAAIDAISLPFTQAQEQSRYFFINSDSQTACELLRAVITERNNTSPTRPQLDRALIAIKTARAGSVYEAGNGVKLRFTTRTFLVETP
jgi:tRNA(Ile)-lysidine synthase